MNHDKRIRIERYTQQHKADWNSFVSTSRNATFLINRDFMDYHCDRFVDYSLVAYRGGKIVGLLPANIRDGVIYSHQGLTYGGWVLGPRHFDGADVLELMESTIEFCRKNGISAIDYKSLPYIYAKQPSQEDLYAIFRCGGKLVECNLSSVIRLADNEGFSTLQRRNLKHAAGNFDIRSCTSLDVDFNEVLHVFYEMLCDCLRERHDVLPVHSESEMKMLMERFPENIRLHLCFSRKEGVLSNVEYAEKPVAGVMMFDTPQVAHCQYIASTRFGRDAHALPLLFHKLIHEDYSDKCYFDFGTSNESGGRVLNDGLLHQKYGLGGRGVVYERYRIDVPEDYRHD